MKLLTLIILLVISLSSWAAEIKNLEAWNDVDKLTVDFEVEYPHNIEYFEVQGSNDGYRWETAAKVKATSQKKYQSVIPIVGIPVLAFLGLVTFRRNRAIIAFVIMIALVACTKEISTTKAITQAQAVRIREVYKNGLDNISQVVRVLPRSQFPKALKKTHMQKLDLVNQITKQTGIPKVDVLVVLEKVMQNIKTTVTAGEGVYLRGFGTFAPKKRAAKIARNIKAGKSLPLPEHYIPSFRPSKEFKYAVIEGAAERVANQPLPAAD